MASRFLEVDPDLVWQKGKTEYLNRLIGAELIKPWSDLRKLPEFSYQTSYQVAFPRLYQFKNLFEPPASKKRSGESAQKEEGFKFELFKNQYTTTTGSTYEPKYVKVEPGEKPSFIHYLDEFKSQFQKKLSLLPSITTETEKNYQWNVYDRPMISGELKDHSANIFCKSPKIAKEMQPSFETNEGGIRREKDIYKSQTHYAHHYFPPATVREIKESQDGIVPRIRVYENPHPIDPELRIPFRQVNLRKKINPVPNRGMITESQEHFRPQVDMFACSENKDVEIIPYTGAAKEDMITAMGRFHTDYNHIGHNWNTQNI